MNFPLIAIERVKMGKNLEGRDFCAKFEPLIYFFKQRGLSHFKK